MLKKLLLIVVIAIVGILAYAATRPGTMHVERSVTMHAPADKIFPYINDFHAWKDWSPYEKIDPAMQKFYGGSPNGVGSLYQWKGNSNVGEGRMEITNVAAPSRVTIKLDFVKPIEGHDVATFSMVSQGDSTTVTWAIDGQSPYVAKLMGVFVNMDKMVGGDFETGLGNLKALVEK